MKNPATAFLVTFLICGTLFLIAEKGADTAVSIKNSGYVTVKGYATQKITSDFGIFEMSILSKSPDLKAAYEKLSMDKEAVTQLIIKKGVKEKEILVSPVQVREKFALSDRGYETPMVDHYIVTQTFQVESKNVQQIAQLSFEASDLLGQGIQINAVAPRFLYTSLENLKIEMIGKATANAKERANVLSKNGKFKLGRVSDIRVGVFQITPANSTEVEDYGRNDTSTIEKEIKCVVEIRNFVK